MITLQLRGTAFKEDGNRCWYPTDCLLSGNPIFAEMEESLGIVGVLGYLATISKEGPSFRRRFEELVIP